jgi:adenylate kinase family enzyme
LFQEELERDKEKSINGWVMDGFPKTIEHFTALKNANLLPTHSFILRNGTFFRHNA